MHFYAKQQSRLSLRKRLLQPVSPTAAPAAVLRLHTENVCAILRRSFNGRTMRAFIMPGLCVTRSGRDFVQEDASKKNNKRMAATGFEPARLRSST
jgi:hypothetical protein